MICGRGLSPRRGMRLLAALRFHLRYCVLDQAEDAVDIYGDGAVPLVVGQAIDRGIFGRPYSVIGYKDVEASEGLDGRCYQLLGRSGGREIGLDGATVGGAAFFD